MKRLHVEGIGFLYMAIFISICYAAPSYAATSYYVRTNGSDNCNGMTDASGSTGNCAFSSVQKGVTAAQPGDTVIIHTGDYSAPNPTIASVRSGTSGSPITIRAAEGESVTISRASLTHNYIVLKGFKITKSGRLYSAGVHMGGSYCQVVSNTIIGNCQPWVGGEDCNAALNNEGAYNVISNNIIDGLNNSQTNGFGIGIRYGFKSNHCTTANNTFTGMNSPGRIFELNGSYHQIANNEIKNCSGEHYGMTHPDIFQVFGTAGSHDHIIENNYFHDCGTQLGNLEADGNAPAFYNWTFRNNIFANIKSELFIYFPITFYNNTFYRCTKENTGNVINACYGVGKFNGYNNAFIDCGFSTNNGWYSCPGSADYNFVANSSTGGVKTGFNEPHGANGGNPYLKATYSNCTSNACDFHIGASSALIDVGTAVSSFTKDKDGVTRPQGKAWDIGAYEYPVSGAIPPASPQNLRVVTTTTSIAR